MTDVTAHRELLTEVESINTDTFKTYKKTYGKGVVKREKILSLKCLTMKAFFEKNFNNRLKGIPEIFFPGWERL